MADPEAIYRWRRLDDGSPHPVSAFFYRYHRDILGWDETRAREEMETVWHPEGVWVAFIT